MRDNPARLKKELGMNDNRKVTQNKVEQDTTTDNTNKWTNEMKVNLMKIEERERNRGRGFMKRMKEAWDTIYVDKPMSAQTLRDKAARFRKNNTQYVKIN